MAIHHCYVELWGKSNIPNYSYEWNKRMDFEREIQSLLKLLKVKYNYLRFCDLLCLPYIHI